MLSDVKDHILILSNSEKQHQSHTDFHYYKFSWKINLNANNNHKSETEYALTKAKHMSLFNKAYSICPCGKSLSIYPEKECIRYPVNMTLRQ